MSAIRELIEAVEAGDLHLVNAVLGKMSVPPPDWCWDWISKVNSAFRGSLDAARALHEAVLPLPWVAVVMTANERMKPGAMVCKVVDGTVHADDEFKAEADTPARAWLIAILKALAARGADG
jgi:hypothetical protein